MKKYIPLLVAAVVFILAILLLQPESKVQVVVLDQRPAGRARACRISIWRCASFPNPSARWTPSSIPPKRSGRRSRPTARRATSCACAHLGEPMTLQPDERAIAIRVDDASGMGGLIAPGDIVGLTAVIFDQRA